MGGVSIPTLWIEYFYRFSSSLYSLINLNSGIYIKLFLLFPIPILSFYSAYQLSKIINNQKFSWLAPLIYSTNTFILMITGGGQFGVGLGYSIVPLILYYAIIFLSKSNPDFKIIFKISLLFGLQMVFDIRMAYLTIVCALLYFAGIVLSGNIKSSVKHFSPGFLALVLSLLLNSFWVLPLISIIKNTGVFTASWLEFLSVSNFSNSISLLHPNWPENIFGKTYFMQPEFLLLPVMAFSSLLFINGLTSLRVKKLVLFFSFIGLVGAFLAKGANEPLGGIYIWLFEHVPGFVMFRDPTKWYTLIALSYSVLIPFSLSMMYEKCRQINKFLIYNLKFLVNFKFLNNQIINLQNVFLILVISYLLFLIRPAILGQLGGTFKPSKVPSEYVALKDYLYNQKDYFRTFWVPNVQRFGFYTNNHPAVDSFGYFKVNSVDEVISKLNENNSPQLLAESAVKYIIVPFDAKGEMFLTERKYDESKYEDAVEKVSGLPWLKRVDGFGKIAVFETSKHKEHFFINGFFKEELNVNSPLENGFTGSRVNGFMINPTKYIVQVDNAKKGEILVFSEGYDRNWKLIESSSKYQVSSIKYENRFNSFILPKDGRYRVEIYYEPQKWVEVGLIISITTFILCILFLSYTVLLTSDNFIKYLTWKCK